MIKVINEIVLIGSCLLLLLLILSDFGLIFPSENTFARVLLHLSSLLLIISSGFQLRTKD